MDHKLISDVSFADAIVSYELGQNKDPRGVVRAITINQRLADFAVNRVIGDWVRVVDGQTSHDDEYVIMGEQWAWRPGDKFDVSYVLQPTSTLQFIFIDVTNKNDIDGGRYIAV